MTVYRTNQQKEADKMDLALFNAISTAEDFSKRSQNWRNILQGLRAARSFVRQEMHPDDRAEKL